MTLLLSAIEHSITSWSDTFKLISITADCLFTGRHAKGTVSNIQTGSWNKGKMFNWIIKDIIAGDTTQSVLR